MPAGPVLAAAGAGFLPFNGLTGGPARMFLGDVGSYGIGARSPCCPGRASCRGLPLEMALAPLVVWLADTVHTLMLRIAAGERWFLPHRTHAYQRLTDTGWSHRQVAAGRGAVHPAGRRGRRGRGADGPLAWRLLGGAGLVAVGALGSSCPPGSGTPPRGVRWPAARGGR